MINFCGQRGFTDAQLAELFDSSLGLIEDLEKSGICREGDSGGHVRMLCTDFSPRLEETFRLLLGDTRYDSLQTIDLNGV